MIGYYFIENKYKYVRECEMSGIYKATRKMESMKTEDNEKLLHNKKNKTLQNTGNISMIYKKLLNYIFL